MCSSAIEGSTRAAELSGDLGAATLVLLLPPVVLFTAFLVVLYRMRDSHESEPVPRSGGAVKKDAVESQEWKQRQPQVVECL
jgi:hypothetical protein